VAGLSWYAVAAESSVLLRCVQQLEVHLGHAEAGQSLGLGDMAQTLLHSAPASGL